MNPEQNQYKVLIVDDSPFMRIIITEILETNPLLKVVGTSFNGRMALNQVLELEPDVITLDVEMPVMDGLQTLEAFQKIRPTPVIMFSSLTKKGAEITIKALELGAFDFMQKPDQKLGVRIEDIRHDLIAKVIAAAQSVKKVRSKFDFGGRTFHVPKHIEKTGKVFVIGSSTGGPQALKNLIPSLPKDFPASILIVQHMPPKFTEMFAQRLDVLSQIRVSEAKEGDYLEPGKVLLAPGGYHMCVDQRGRINLNQDPPLWGVRPSVDITLQSVAKIYKHNVISVILTGMGHDGRDGSRIVRQFGGYSIAEHESSCVVFGMPKSVIDANQADVVAPLDKIPDEIIKALSR
jgi:two-component system chemotaxis response regulator CheB